MARRSSKSSRRNVRRSSSGRFTSKAGSRSKSSRSRSSRSSSSRGMGIEPLGGRY